MVEYPSMIRVKENRIDHMIALGYRRRACRRVILFSISVCTAEDLGKHCVAESNVVFVRTAERRLFPEYIRL